MGYVFSPWHILFGNNGMAHVFFLHREWKQIQLGVLLLILNSLSTIISCEFTTLQLSICCTVSIPNQ